MLNELSKQQLRGIITDYNLHYAIRGFSKMTKDELIVRIKDFLEPIRGADNITIYLIPLNRVKNINVRPPKKRASRAKPQPEFIDIVPSKRTTQEELMRFIQENQIPESKSRLYPEDINEALRQDKLRRLIKKVKKPIPKILSSNDINDMLMNLEKVIKQKKNKK